MIVAATPAFAATPAEVAIEAARVRDELCSDAAGDDTTLAATRHGEVSAVWGQVSEVYESSQQPFLLYWRGVLEQCLDQEERARGDLEAFLVATADDSTYADLRRDAKGRLRRLAARERGSRGSTTPALIVGVVTAASAGAFGGLAGWQHTLSEDAVAEYYGGELMTADFARVEDEAVGAAQRRNGLAVIGGALAAASAASFVTVVAGSASSSRPQVAVTVMPRVDGGVAIGVAGRW